MTRFQLFRKNVWLVLKRAPRDRRAAGVVLIWLCMVAWLAYELGSFYYLGVWGTLCCIVVLALGVGIAILIGRSHQRADASLLKLSGNATVDVGDAAAFAEHRNRLSGKLLRTVALVDRAACESFLRNGKPDPQKSGLWRRRSIELARRPDLWDGFADDEKSLLLSPEGSWVWDQVWPRIVQVEDVRVLRWVLGMDAILTPFEFLKPDLSPVFEVAMKPGSVDGVVCLPPWDLRPARAMAQRMVSRCVAEGVHRGYLTEEDATVRSQYLALAEGMRGDEATDMLIGDRVVARAQDSQIQWVAQAALRRVFVLNGVIEYLGGSADRELAIRTSLFQ